MADPYGLVGSVLSQKYRVDRVIGEGGFGVVYAATHLVLGQPVAVKCLKTQDRASFDAFLREAQILFQLSHPAIVRLFDAGTVSHPSGLVPWVVLELVSGTSLEAEIRSRAATRRPFSTAEIARIFAPLIDAVAFAHERGVVHRDLKPSNVMLTPGDPPARILDFGTARAVGQRSLGQTGASPAYAAPEQWDASLGATGPATDVFGLGMTLAEAVLLAPPLGGGGLSDLLAAAMDPSRRPNLAVARPDLPFALGGVVERALRVRPEQRFANAREMSVALRAALGLAPGSSYVSSLAPTPPPAAGSVPHYPGGAYAGPPPPAQKPGVSPALVIIPVALFAVAAIVLVIVLVVRSMLASFTGGTLDDGQPALGIISDPNAPPAATPPPPAPPPTSGPFLATGDVDGTPFYALGDVLSVERPHHHDIDACAAQIPAGHALEGEVELGIDGTKEGVVTSSDCTMVGDGRNLVTEDKNPDAIALCSCVEQVAASWRFPKTRGRIGLLTEFHLSITYKLIDRSKK